MNGRTFRAWMLLYTFLFMVAMVFSVLEAKAEPVGTSCGALLYATVIAGNLLYSFGRVPNWRKIAAKVLLPIIVAEEIIAWRAACVVYFKVAFLGPSTRGEQQLQDTRRSGASAT